jgi:hypothetical protein
MEATQSERTTPAVTDVPRPDIYAPLVDDLLKGYGGTWKGKVYVYTRICTDEVLHDVTTCSGSLSKAEKLVLLARLPGIDLRFTRNPGRIITLELMEHQAKSGGSSRNAAAEARWLRSHVQVVGHHKPVPDGSAGYRCRACQTYVRFVTCRRCGMLINFYGSDEGFFRCPSCHKKNLALSQLSQEEPGSAHASD